MENVVRRSGAGFAVVIVAAVLLVLLVAAPAMAAPSATSLVASPNLSTVALGDSPTISATLTDTGSTLPVGGETLRVEQATSNSGPWSLTDLVTTDVTTGVGTYDVLPTGTTYYRFVFEGTGAYAAATSNVLTVLVTPFTTTLTASPITSTVNIGDSVTISATLMDTVNTLPVDGATVRVEQAASDSGPWTLVNYADNEGGSGVYSLELYPAATAYYRFVYAPDPVDTYLGSTSNVLTVTIRLVPTSLTASPAETTVTSGAGATISAVLMDTDATLAVGGQVVRVEQAASNSGPWSLADLVTTDVTTGVGTYNVLPTGTTYYRFVFVATDTYAAATSNVLTVLVTPIATTLTASPITSTVNIGDSVTISATLMDSVHTLPVDGATVRVEQATSNSGPWTLANQVTTDATTGVVTYDAVPTQTTYYRFVFGGTGTYAASQSDALTVKAKPVLNTPTCPTSIKKNKSFTVKGTVRPGTPGGPGVKIQAYRKHNGSWSKYKSAHTTTRSGTKYSVKMKINATGKFKFKASIATSSKFVGVTTRYSKVTTVK